MRDDFIRITALDHQSWIPADTDAPVPDQSDVPRRGRAISNDTASRRGPSAKPEVALVDPQMAKAGVRAFTALCEQFPSARVVFLTNDRAEPGSDPLPPDLFAEAARHVIVNPPTHREREILRRVALGLSNKHISRELVITEGTVKSHIKTILGKLNARNRTHAVVIALGRGFLSVAASTGDDAA